MYSLKRLLSNYIIVQTWPNIIAPSSGVFDLVGQDHIVEGTTLTITRSAGYTPVR